MLNKILLATQGKPCSCPTGKICPACKKKKPPLPVKPIVSVEGHKALPVPVKIETYKVKTPTTVLQPHRKKIPFSENPSNAQSCLGKKCSRKATPLESTSKETKICRWYKRRKALGELRKITKQEREKLRSLQLEKARREREAEFLDQLIRREREVRLAEQQLAATPKVIRPLNECPHLTCDQQAQSRKRKRRAKREKKRKAAEAKRCCQTQVVCEYAKKYQKRPFNERFSIFCYKLCCQFYCCLTCIMLIGLAIIYFF